MTNETHEATTIAVCSNKGGVGKTTATSCIGHLLGESGKKVLLIDADPQGNLSRRYGYEPTAHNDKQLSAAVESYVSNSPEPIENFIEQTDFPNVDIIPGDDRLTLTRNTLMASVSQFGVNAYKEIINAIVALKKYDYVIIDTRPALDEEISQIMFAVNWLVIPTKASVDSVQGAGQTIQYQVKCRRANPNLRVAGVFFNIVEQNTESAHMTIPALEGQLQNIVMKTKIPKNETAVKSENRTQPMTALYKSCKASKAYKKLLDELVKTIG